MCHDTFAQDALGISKKTWLGAGCLLLALCSVAIAGGRGSKTRTTVSRGFYEGRELFVKTWEPGQPSPIGGDGLGPLYNEQSCLGCHHLGGVGGGGRNDRNVRMLTAVASPGNAKRGGKVFQGELGDLHNLFRGGASIVLHRQATAQTLTDRLREVAAYTQVDRHGEILDLTASARNTPAIFGAGRIDAIPGEVLIAAEERKYPGFPEIKGRRESIAGRPVRPVWMEGANGSPQRLRPGRVLERAGPGGPRPSSGDSRSHRGDQPF